MIDYDNIDRLEAELGRKILRPFKRVEVLLFVACALACVWVGMAIAQPAYGAEARTKAASAAPQSIACVPLYPKRCRSRTPTK